MNRFSFIFTLSLDSPVDFFDQAHRVNHDAIANDAGFPRRRMPEESGAAHIFWLPMKTVCPALFPPWVRTTISAPSVRTSMILPLPSSPHCAPTNIVFDISPINCSGRPRRRLLWAANTPGTAIKIPECKFGAYALYLPADAIDMPAVCQSPIHNIKAVPGGTVCCWSMLFLSDFMVTI